jgi:hypothetical protein
MECGDVMYLIPPADDPIEAATGILPEGPFLARELLEERKKDGR